MSHIQSAVVQVNVSCRQPNINICHIVSVGVSSNLTSLFCLCSEEVVRHGFTVIVDMRGSKWDSIKPLLKILQESFPSCIHVALIIKPDNFWQKQRTNFGSSKFEFEVRGFFIRGVFLMWTLMQ